MRLLLDTHVFIWWLGDDKSLSSALRTLIADPQNEVLVSAVSAFEIATKFRLGKLPSAALLAQDVPGYAARAGFEELPLTLAHATRAGLINHSHRDPYDRLLAAQALVEGIPLGSVDRVFDDLAIQRIA